MSGGNALTIPLIFLYILWMEIVLRKTLQTASRLLIDLYFPVESLQHFGMMAAKQPLN